MENWSCFVKIALKIQEKFQNLWIPLTKSVWIHPGCLSSFAMTEQAFTTRSCEANYIIRVNALIISHTP